MANINKIWLRLIIIFLIHIIFKSFDMSFPGGPFDLSIRSLTFSIFFIGYGMVIWILGNWFNLKIIKWIRNIKTNLNKLLILTSLHLGFGFVLMQSFGFLYRYGDLFLFDNNWENVHFLNPELTIGLLGVYILIIGFDGFYNSQKELQEGLLKAEQYKKENILAQYKALKAQIEPHFLFNNLSVLSSLVYKDADLSADFILKLSKTLRYVIEKNAYNLVKLSEELEFLNAYFFLIKTRLDNGVFLENKINPTIINITYIPPATLQLLIENAINHNSYNPGNPLKITIENNNGYIVVRNILNPRTVLKESTKQGLKNISKRYKLISEKEVEISKTEKEFIVKLPVLNQLDYEMSMVNFNT